MKKIITVLLMSIMASALLLSGCGIGGGDTWSDIQKKGEIVVGLDDAFPPMGFRDENDEITGFDIDLAKEAASRMGLKVKFQPVVWDNVIMELNNKNIDLIWNGMSITEERLEKIAITDPYIANRQIIVVNSGSSISNKAGMAGKIIGIQSGSSSIDAFKKDSNTFESIKEMVEFGTNDEALRDLNAGRVDAVVVDEIVGRYYISKYPSDYTVLEENFGEEDYGVGVRKSDKKLLEELQKAIDEMVEDGTAAEISKKWFGEDIMK